MQVLERLPPVVDESRQLCVLRVVLCLVQHHRILVEAEEHGLERLQSTGRAQLCGVMQLFPQSSIMPAPAEEAEVVAAQPRCDVGRHQRSLDQQRARAAQRIDQAAAGRIHAGPAGTQQHGRSEVFLERRDALATTVAALVQRRAGQVETHDRLAAA